MYCLQGKRLIEQFSTFKPKTLGKFVLNIYFSCKKEEIVISKADSKIVAHPISEEEEEVKNFDEKYKQMLRQM